MKGQKIMDNLLRAILSQREDKEGKE